jgi:hypothetical protein
MSSKMKKAHLHRGQELYLQLYKNIILNYYIIIYSFLFIIITLYKYIIIYIYFNLKSIYYITL